MTGQLARHCVGLSISASLAVAWPTGLAAQEPTHAIEPIAAHTAQPLPAVTVHGVRPMPCAAVTGPSRLTCLSKTLNAMSAGNRWDAAPSATSAAPTALGLANEAATRQRMGNTYGVSAFPQARPQRVTPPSPFVRGSP